MSDEPDEHAWIPQYHFHMQQMYNHDMTQEPGSSLEVEDL